MAGSGKKKKNKAVVPARRGFWGELGALALSLLPLALAALLYWAARKFPAFAEWYAVKIYPGWVAIWARAFSWIPFSVSEILLYALVLRVAVGVIIFLVSIIRNRGPFRRGFLPWVRAQLVFLGSLALIFMIGGGINYNRKPFSEVAGFVMQKSSKEELYAVAKRMAEGVAETSPLVERDADGLCTYSGSLAETAAKAMKNLGTEYAALSGYYPNVKKVLWSEFLSYQQISGVFSPFTIEAHYNGAMVSYNMPYTVCHELSHLRGFMREDEANFVSFLACISSDNPYFRYSGYLLGYIYVNNALYGEDRDLWREVRSILPAEVDKDLAANNAFWEKYETKVAEVAQQVNNSYLVVNGQEDGVKSYGRVVDLILAYYRSETE